MYLYRTTRKKRQIHIVGYFNMLSQYFIKYYDKTGHKTPMDVHSFQQM